MIHRIHRALALAAALSLCATAASRGQSSTTTYRYDGIGRLVEVAYPDSSTIHYSYDKNGNILSIIAVAHDRAPTAATATIVTDEDTPSRPVAPTVTDPDSGDTFTISMVTQPAHGTATVDSNRLVYTPAPNFNGSDSLVFRATDRGGLSVDGTAYVTVRPVNDAPLPFALDAPADGSVHPRGPVTFSWTDAVDVDGDTVRYTLRVTVAGTDTAFDTHAQSGTLEFRALSLPPGRLPVTWAVSATDGIAVTQATNNDGSFILDSTSVQGPVFVLSTRHLAFGTVTVGDTKTLAATISNPGTDTLAVSGTTSDDAAFSSLLDAFRVEPGAAAVDSIRFAPADVGPVSATIAFSHGAPGQADTLFVEGIGASPTSTDAATRVAGFSLAQNFPNPVREATSIAFAIPRALPVRLEISTLIGVRVRVLLDATLPAGAHVLPWNAADLPGGLYICRLVAGPYRASRTIVVLR